MGNYSKEQMREYQAKRRGGKTYKSQAEHCAVLVAVASGEISESMGSKLLKCDIFDLRGKLQSLIDEAHDMWIEHRVANPPVVTETNPT